MVSDSTSLSRRRLLGGLAGVAGGTTVAVGATVPTALPDALTDWATKAYPTPPEVNEQWRPTVTEDHASEVVALLEDTVSEGQRLWKRIETDDDFLGAGGWLENARKALRNGNYHEALSDATYGIQFAGEDLGFARAKLGRVELPSLADRAGRLLDRCRRVADDLKPYPTADPGRDLAWYYRIERELVSARLNFDWGELDAAQDGMDDENGPDSSKFDARTVGSITSQILQGKCHLRNAERYRDLLAETVSDSATRYADHLRGVAEEFDAGIDSFPTRDEIRSQFLDEDDDERYGPYEFARSRLARWCFDWDFRFGSGEGEDLLVYRAVQLSKGLAQRRAHDFAVEHLAVERGDTGFDSGRALAEKRRARSVYRSVVGSNPPPLLTRQVRRAVEDLQVAKVGFGGSYQRPRWRERLEAYLYALVGRAKLREYPALFDRIVGAT
ncbi:hypothetical protein M0R89_21625 (plasmid) [Halorussus limi]|uniref:Uncharacterized protein n=1 Tax=Halorussus limi TaxID=2938695 RepID=A0A8U0I182_9EURY|nr:hypothetical protein [Halorussus limi]UPV76793.1 hypothetical protein M0R89_21625 [Halorussus limi]